MFSISSVKEIWNWQNRISYNQARNQIMTLRLPSMELGTLRSSFDLDGIASDAVEGRNKQLDFYRKRGDV